MCVCVCVCVCVCMYMHIVYILQLYTFEKAMPTTDLEKFSSKLAVYNISLSEYRKSLMEEVTNLKKVL